MKSVSDSRPRLSLGRTLRRAGKVWITQPDDLKYAWAGYKIGAFPGFPRDLSAGDFRSYALDVFRGYASITTVSAPTAQGVIPVLFAFAQLWGRYVQLTDLAWMPWASPRNRMESLVRYVQHARIEMDGVMVVPFRRDDPRDKAFGVWVLRHGIARRVGTLDGPDPAAMYQSVRPPL